jgi:hypothetical protein
MWLYANYQQLVNSYSGEIEDAVFTCDDDEEAGSKG